MKITVTNGNTGQEKEIEFSELGSIINSIAKGEDIFADKANKSDIQEDIAQLSKEESFNLMVEMIQMRAKILQLLEENKAEEALKLYEQVSSSHRKYFNAEQKKALDDAIAMIKMGIRLQKMGDAMEEEFDNHFNSQDSDDSDIDANDWVMYNDALCIVVEIHESSPAFLHIHKPNGKCAGKVPESLCTLATHEQILIGLSNEAKRRGFIPGAGLKAIVTHNGKEKTGINIFQDKDFFEYIADGDQLLYGGIPVYEDGVWKNTFASDNTEDKDIADMSNGPLANLLKMLFNRHQQR